MSTVTSWFRYFSWLTYQVVTLESYAIDPHLIGILPYIYDDIVQPAGPCCTCCGLMSLQEMFTSSLCTTFALSAPIYNLSLQALC